MGRRVAVCVLAVAMFTLAIPADAAATKAIHASLSPTAPLELSGNVTIGAGPSIIELRPRFDFWSAGLPVFSAARAAVVIDEYRWQTARASAADQSALELPIGPVDHTQVSHDASALSVLTEDTGGTGHWIIHARYASAARLSASATCSVEPDPRSAGYVFVGSVRAADVPFTFPSAAMGVRCHSHGLEAGGKASYRFSDTRLRLAWVEDGRLQQSTLATGEWTTGDPDQPTQEHLARIVTVLAHPTHETDFGGRLVLGSDAEVAFTTTAFAFAGTLVAPASDGWLKWGANGWTDRLPAFAAEGSFTLSGKTASSLALEGTTWGGTIATAESPLAVTIPPPSPAAYILVAATVALAVIVALLRRLGWLALFTRVARSKILDHPVRRQILDAIQENPGAKLHWIAQLLGLPRGTVRHHANVLVQNKLVETASTGRLRRFLPAASRDEVAVIGGPLAKDLLEQLRRQPARSQAELARTLRTSPSSVCRLLRRLHEHHLVRLVGRGPGRRYLVAKDDAS